MDKNIEQKNYSNNDKDKKLSIKKTILGVLAALTVSSTISCDTTSSNVNREREFVEIYDKETNLLRYLSEFKSDYPYLFTKESLEKQEKELDKNIRLANDILALLMLNYKTLNDKVIIIDLPSDIDVVINEIIKQGRQKGLNFNTVFYVSPNWPSDKSLKPLVDYSKLFQTIELLKKKGYKFVPDNYVYTNGADNKVELNPLVILYDYNRIPNISNYNDLPGKQFFPNSYILEQDDFLSLSDFGGNDGRKKVIVFTPDPINEDLKKYILRLKEHNIPVDVFVVDLKDLKIKNVEGLEELRKKILSDINRRSQESSGYHSSGSSSFWYRWFFLRNNEVCYTDVKSRPLNIKENIKTRTLPPRFKGVSIRGSSIRGAGAGKGFSARGGLG